MRPVLFHLRGVPIHSYLAMLYLGMVAGVEVGDIAAHAAGMDSLRVLLALVLLLGPALVGARLLFVAYHWRIYRENPHRIWNTKEPGAAQYGGILLALPLSVPLVQVLHLSWGGFWDVAVFTAIVGVIFGRFGCFLNGCCAGRRSNSLLALYLPDAHGVRARRLPTQLLEAGWAAAMLITAVLIRSKMPFQGALFWVIAAGYAAGRFVLLSMREPEPGARQFTIQHGVSASLILWSLAMLAYRWPNS
jgi:phosphatidylglycerol---prolipoprotein diacylglyceryl transferase